MQFIFRTKDGLIFGPYATYEQAVFWSKRTIFEIDDVYAVNALRPDQMKGASS